MGMKPFNCNVVLEGGGVRGIGHVGAACVLEEQGYRFRNLVGSSAGAIVASLLVVGYSAKELLAVMETLDYRKFRKDTMLSRFGYAGRFMSLVTGFGIYSADYLEEWLGKLLMQKGRRVFGDIRNEYPQREHCEWKLQVTASDVTDQKLLILPRDLAQFGIDPDSFEIVKAVRMSMSIPLYYRPYQMIGLDGREHLIVDGGLLSNYPLWLFGAEGQCTIPTIGFKFMDDDAAVEPWDSQEGPLDFIRYLKMLANTALDGADKQHIEESRIGQFGTVSIPVQVTVDGREKKIRSTDFDITREESRKLYENGEAAAIKFLDNKRRLRQSV